MRKFRCIDCHHEFEVQGEEIPQHCPKCYNRYVELVEGPPIKGKPYGSKSFSVAPKKN